MQVFVTDINSDDDVIFDFLYDEEFMRFQNIIEINTPTPNNHNASMVKITKLQNYNGFKLQSGRLYELEDTILKKIISRLGNNEQQSNINNKQRNLVEVVSDSFLIAYSMEANEGFRGLLKKSDKYISRKEYYKVLKS